MPRLFLLFVLTLRAIFLDFYFCVVSLTKLVKKASGRREPSSIKITQLYQWRLPTLITSGVSSLSSGSESSMSFEVVLPITLSSVPRSIKIASGSGIQSPSSRSSSFCLTAWSSWRINSPLVRQIGSSQVFRRSACSMSSVNAYWDENDAKNY